MDMAKYHSASLDRFKGIAFKQIKAKYKTMEEFSYVNDISKSLLSYFFSEKEIEKKKDFQYSTVERIAKALHIKIIFKIEKQD